MFLRIIGVTVANKLWIWLNFLITNCIQFVMIQLRGRILSFSEMNLSLDMDRMLQVDIESVLLDLKIHKVERVNYRMVVFSHFDQTYPSRDALCPRGKSIPHGTYRETTIQFRY